VRHVGIEKEANPLAAWWWKQRRWKEAVEAGEIEHGLLSENLRPRAVETLNLSE